MNFGLKKEYTNSYIKNLVRNNANNTFNMSNNDNKHKDGQNKFLNNAEV